jgi:hypothetical protein
VFAPLTTPLIAEVIAKLICVDDHVACVDVAPSLIEALDERADLSSFTAATRDVLSVVDRDESDPEIARSDLHSVAMRVVKSVIRAARDDMRSTSN